MKKNSTIFDTINSVVVTGYANNAVFAIVKVNETTVISDYHKNNRLYKFDVVNGTLKEYQFDGNIEKVDIDRFVNAVKCEWYQREFYKTLDTCLLLANITDEQQRSYCITNNIDENEYAIKYNMLIARLKTVNEVCKAYDMKYVVGKTVKTIVDVLYDGAVDSEVYKTHIANIDSKLSKINEKIDKDNDSISVKSLKSVVSDFTHDVWAACENDGIMDYHYNANTTLVMYVLGQCRKLSNVNGHMQWACVSTDRVVKHIVFAMLARLYELKHTDDNKKAENK